jgi:hypothetical protein
VPNARFGNKTGSATGGVQPRNPNAHLEPALDVIYLYFRTTPELTDEVGVADAEKAAAAAWAAR